jgi:hypothetical protein
MHTQTFALAPRPGSHEWGQALAFALPPSAGIYAVLHWMVGQPLFGAIAAGVVFLGVFLSALLLIRPQIGAIEMDGHHLRLLSGALDVRLPLEALELADPAAKTNPSIPAAGDDAPVLSLVTDPARRVTLALRSGGTVELSPLDPAAFLHALGQKTPAPTFR